MSVAANMNFIWGSIASKQSTMIQTDQGPMRINSIRAKYGKDFQIMAISDQDKTCSLITVTPDNCDDIRSKLF